MATLDFNTEEQELDRLLPKSRGKCPPVDLLLAAGQEVLPPEVEAQVQGHLAACKLCTMLVADMRTLPEPELTAEQVQRIAATLPVQRVSSHRSMWRYAGIAAAILVVAGAADFTWTHRQAAPVQVARVEPAASVVVPEIEIPLSPLAAPNDAPTLLTRGNRRTKHPSTEELLPAFIPYNRGDYQLAETQFAKLAKSYPQSDRVLLYLGVSQLMLHQDTVASDTLKHARSVAEPAQLDAALWYSAIAAQHIHSSETAGLLKTLCDRKDSTYAAESCRILPTLK